MDSSIPGLEEPRIEPPIFPLVDDPLYRLSHSCPHLTLLSGCKKQSEKLSLDVLIYWDTTYFWQLDRWFCPWSVSAVKTPQVYFPRDSKTSYTRNFWRLNWTNFTDAELCTYSNIIQLLDIICRKKHVFIFSSNANGFGIRWSTIMGIMFRFSHTFSHVVQKVVQMEGERKNWERDGEEGEVRGVMGSWGRWGQEGSQEERIEKQVERRSRGDKGGESD